MKLFCQFCAIVVVLVLMAVGISKNAVETLPAPQSGLLEDKQETHLSAVAQTDSFCLLRQMQSLVGGSSQLPAPASKFLSGLLLPSQFLQGLNIPGAVNRVAKSTIALRSVRPVSTIIFPFHYFW